MLADGSIAIAICDRCRMKRPYTTLAPDPNYPGLRVCDQGCRDEYDPYRLPPRAPDPISMRFPRPDADLTDPNQTFVVSQNDELINVDNTNAPVNEDDLAP